MSLIQCANGHFYNSAVNQSCPHCQGQASAPSGKTVGVVPPQPNKPVAPPNVHHQGVIPPQPNKSNTIPHSNNQGVVPPQPNLANHPNMNQHQVTPPPTPSPRPSSSEEGKTIGLFMKKEGIDPVVGWFVCIEGKDRGQDYRIHSERNTIGRGSSNDITIKGDETISRENHATVVYDPKRKNFRLLAGGGRGLVYVNDEAVDYSVVLKEGDKIEMGETKLMFVPLCGAKFDW